MHSYYLQTCGLHDRKTLASRVIRHLYCYFETAILEKLKLEPSMVFKEEKRTLLYFHVFEPIIPTALGLHLQLILFRFYRCCIDVMHDYIGHNIAKRNCQQNINDCGFYSELVISFHTLK